jgi:hypothetical protein
MKIARINLSNLRNEEHFQFQTEFKDEINLFGAKTLNIETAFATYLPLYEQEEKALQLIRKSAATDQLIEADTERDDIYRGLVDAIKSALKHFDPNKRAAASRLKVLFDQYGNVARKPYDEETAAINKIMVESKGAYAADITALAISDWFTMLETKNNAFDTIMKSRYSEEAGKTELRMNQVRLEVDATYREIMDRIDALILINGHRGYENFTREHNARVDKFSNTLAQRAGRKAKKSDKKEQQTPPTA